MKNANNGNDNNRKEILKDYLQGIFLLLVPIIIIYILLYVL